MSSDCPVPIRDRDRILMGHGSGGRLTADLVERILVPAFRNPMLDPLEDGARVEERFAFTTDSYVVTPIFFPGGDIGELAVNGTINDLAMCGARPIALSLALILEEGLEMQDFERIVASVRSAAARAEVPIATGDTKVVGRGAADKIFINTSGIGAIEHDLASSKIAAGDAVIVSGTIGDHGATILAQREGLRLGGDLHSDTAPLYGLARAIWSACPDVHAMRDPTRGGLASVLSEIATRRNLGIDVEESALPIHESVRGACELFGIDPLFVANEGKLVLFVPESSANAALEVMQRHALGKNATRIGTVTSEHARIVVLRNRIGGNRVLDLPLGEALPRIC